MKAKQLLKTISASKLITNPAIQAITRFYVKNEPQILTAGTIAFFGASEVIIYRNSPQIHACIDEYKYRISDISPYISEDEQKELKNVAMTDALKALGKLTAPLIIFNGLAIGCAILSGKAYTKRIASLTAALTMSQNALSEYEHFREEAIKQIGAEKVNEIESEAIQNAETGARQIPQDLHKKDGEDYIYEALTGRYFVAREADIDLAIERANHWLDIDGGSHSGIVTLNDVLGNLGLDDTEGGDVFGWYEGSRITYRLDPMRMAYRDGGHAALIMTFTEKPKVIDDEYLFS